MIPRPFTHDGYGRRVVSLAAGPALDGSREACRVDYGGASHTGGFIDATVGGRIAVEIESRVSKQVRGAVLDLLVHRHSKKRLLLLNVHQNNVALTAAQCRHAMGKFLSARDFRVIVLEGTGSIEMLDADVATVRSALSELSEP